MLRLHSWRGQNGFGRVAGLGLACVISQATAAAPPTLEHLYPAGVPRDSTNQITLSGKFEPWPPQVWADTPALAFNAETNKGKLQVTIAPTAEPGPHLIRIYNPEGASEPRFLVIADQTELSELEPNNHFAKPQRIEQLPVSVNGRLDKNGDTDCFAVPLTAGEWLEARLDAYVLMSKLDGVLRLVTTNGQQLAWNHDYVTLDPQLLWRATNDQVVIVQVMGFAFPANAEVRLAGGEGAVYRLHLARTTNSPRDVCADLPNAQPGTNAISLPATVTGVIARADEEHLFRFEIEKDQFLEAIVEAAAIGSPLDTWLKITDVAGKQIAQADDSGGARDPKLEWKATTNGPFHLVVGNVLHKGSRDHRYRLNVRTVEPDFTVSLNLTAFAIGPGQTNEVKLKLNRLRGFDHKLTFEFQDLPTGVTAEPVEAPEKSGDVTLKLLAAADAAPFNGTVAIMATDAAAGTKRKINATLTGATEDNGVPGGYQRLLVEKTDQLWLTVRPKPAADAPATSKEKSK